LAYIVSNCCFIYLGYNTRALALDKGSIVLGTDYQIKLTVSGGGFATTTIYLYRTLKTLPYGGTCTLQSSTGRCTTQTKSQYVPIIF